MVGRRHSFAWLAALVGWVAAVCVGCGRPPNVLLIVVDTLRADRVGAYGATLELTPHVDALAAESTVFERAYAPSSYTLPSVVGLLTSRHPEEAGVDYNTHRLGGDIPTLAEFLRSHGWRTGAVVSNYVLREDSGVLRGFEEHDVELREREAVRGFADRAARQTTDAALRMWERLGAAPRRPRFLWVHYQDPHGPYTPPDGYREAFLDAERAGPGGRRRLRVSDDGAGGIPRYQLLPGSQREVAFYRAGYDGEVRYTDEEIGRLLVGLRERGLGEAIVVFAADHGEALGEANRWFAHGELLIEPLTHVPLLIHVPGRGGERRRDVASLLDVLPTLAGLLGLEPPRAQRGRNLFAAGAPPGDLYLAMPGRGHSAIPRFALIADGYKYVVERTTRGTVEHLYRLGSDAPDRAGEEPKRVIAMRRRLEQIRRDLPDSAHPPKLSPEERRALEAMGYVTD